ncbi:MAG: C25 family cysteine peptidase [Bacteroidota bacterium]
MPGFSEKWLLEPQRGAIMTLNFTSAAYLNPLRDFMGVKSEELFAKTPDARIGDVLKTSLNLYTDSLIGIQYRNHARYMLLQGDPALRLFNATNIPIDSVWPGDVNYDGVANMEDLLQLGLAYGDSGYARLNPTNNWEAQYCLPWDEAFANGFNKKYADCDGNGIVNAADTLAISLNYGSIHQKTENSNFTETGIPLTLLIPQVINPGDTAVIQVIAGDSLNPSALYGLRFKINYDTAVVEAGQMWVDFSDSWLGEEGAEILGMYKDQRFEGEIEVGMTRLNQQAMIGGGKAADINIVITDDIAKQEWSLKSFSFTQGAANDETGDEVPLNALAAWNNDLPPIEPLYVRIFPSPVVDQICIERSDHRLSNFALWDLQAKQIASWTDEEIAIGCLQVTNLRSGVYLLTFEEDGMHRTQKIIVVE